ncbi:MAG: HNH endonuclease, partial [Nitrospira sp.]|nr:HNH endonuclease [Nitrospira sp.]
GSNNYHWKGGRTRHSKGYIYVYAPEHPAADKHGYVFEHRLVMEKIIGRPLRPDEVVHHIDGYPANNRDEENLILLTNNQHTRLENFLKRSVQKSTAP